MRKFIVLFVLLVLTFAAGCPREGGFNLLRPSPVNPALAPDEPPREAQAYVDYLNNVSANIPGIQSDDITLTVHTGGPINPSIQGNIRAQGPRNFRMAAKFMGKDELDLGSNSQEFWYWIRQGPKAQYFCSYQAIEEGNVRNMPFPFQPDWVLEAMGMGHFGPAEKYELVHDKDKKRIRLIERTKSPQGLPVKKVIVFSANKTRETEPQVTDFLLVDESNNKLICAAHITKRQLIPIRGTKTSAELPREMVLEWPEQKMKLGITLNGVQLNQQLAAQSFMRPRLNGIDSVDLATMQIEGIRPAGGTPGFGKK